MSVCLSARISAALNGRISENLVLGKLYDFVEKHHIWLRMDKIFSLVAWTTTYVSWLPATQVRYCRTAVPLRPVVLYCC